MSIRLQGLINKYPFGSIIRVKGLYSFEAKVIAVCYYDNTPLIGVYNEEEFMDSQLSEISSEQLIDYSAAKTEDDIVCGWWVTPLSIEKVVFVNDFNINV